MEKKHQNVEKITTRQWALEFNDMIGRKVFYIPSKFSYKQHGLFTFILYAGQRFDKIDMSPVKDLNIFDNDYKTFFNSVLTAEELADPNIRAALHRIAKTAVKEINMIFDAPIKNFEDRYDQMKIIDTRAHHMIQVFLHCFYRDFTPLLKITINTSKVHQVDITNIWPVFKEDVDASVINCFMKYNKDEDKYSFIDKDIVIDYIYAKDPIKWLYLADDMLLKGERFLHTKIEEEIDYLVDKIVKTEGNDSIVGIIKQRDYDILIKGINNKISTYRAGDKADFELCGLYKRLLNVYKYNRIAKTDHYLYYFLNILHAMFISPITERTIIYRKNYTDVIEPIDDYIKKNCRGVSKIKTPNINSSVKIFNHLMDRHQIMVKAKKTNTNEYKDLLAAIYRFMEFPENDYYFKLLLTCLNTARTPYSLKNMTIVPEDIIVMMVDLYRANNKTFAHEELIVDPEKVKLYENFTKPLTIEMFDDRNTADYKTIDVGQVILKLGYVDDINKLQRRLGFLGVVVKTFSTKVVVIFNSDVFGNQVIEVEHIGHNFRQLVDFIEISFDFNGENILIYRKNKDMIYDIGNDVDPEKLNETRDKLFYHVLTGHGINFECKFKSIKELIDLKSKGFGKIVDKVKGIITSGEQLAIKRLECRATLPTDATKKDDDEEFGEKIIRFYV